jgi:hypothetical protein
LLVLSTEQKYSDEFLAGLDSNPIVDRTPKALLAAEIFLRRLNRDVIQQKFNLL